MIFENKTSQRENPFRQVYDSGEFKNVLKNRDNIRNFPYLVDAELTNCCNLNCIFCSQQAMTRQVGFMPEGVLKKIADECKQHNAPIRFIRWGEPFLHPKLTDFCDYIKAKGLLLHITNNGLAIKQRHMRALVELGVDSLIFSFQGVTKKEYGIMRNNRLFDKLCDNIRKMVKIRGDKDKPFIHISSTVTYEGEKKIKEFGNYWSSIVDSVGIGKTNLSRLSDGQIKSFETRDRLKLLKKKETVEKFYRPCTEVYQKLSVDWDGKVSCCCGDYNNYLNVGDVNESGLSDIWNKSKRLSIFRELLDKNLHRSLTLCSTCFHTYEKF